MSEQKTLIERICAAKGEIHAVPKNGWNPHHKYKFASVDDIYIATRPVLAKHMLDLVCEVQSREPTEDRKYVNYVFAIGFRCPEEPDAPLSPRYLSCQFAGPQTDEIAVSYVQKQFLRARLQIPTGDMADDLDSAQKPEDDAPPQPPVEMVGEEQVEWMQEMIRTTESDMDKFLKAFGVPSLAKMSMMQFRQAEKMLKTKAARMVAPKADKQEAAPTDLPTEGLTDEQIGILTGLLNQTGRSALAVQKNYGISDLRELPEKTYVELVKALRESVNG